MICTFSGSAAVYVAPSVTPTISPSRTPSVTPSPTTVWYGYSLDPVADGTCSPPTGTSVTAYKILGGSLNVGDVLYTDYGVTTLSTGFYSDGTYRYVVNVGEITNKITCSLLFGTGTWYTLY
jgi:hypothetical protein